MRLSNFIIKNIVCRNIKPATICSLSGNTSLIRCCSSKINENYQNSEKFETVFSFPFVRHIATLNRMKLYHLLGSSLAIPGSLILENMNIFPQYSFLATSYIGVTGGILLSLASLPLNNAIGFIYISEDNKLIKISSVDFWGRRKDKIIPAHNWVPLFELEPKTMDAIYLTPKLTDGSDGTKYKLFAKFGKVLNSTKMGEVIE